MKAPSLYAGLVILLFAVSFTSFGGFFAPQADAQLPTRLSETSHCRLRATVSVKDLQTLVDPRCGISSCADVDKAPLEAGWIVADPDSSVTADENTKYWGLICGFATVKSIADLLFLVVTVLSIACIVYAGFLFLRSGGDPTTVKDARQWLLYAVIGLVVAILARAIPGIAMSLVGLGG